MKKYITSLYLLGTLSLLSCNDSFMDKYPLNEPTEQNAFKSYDNFKAFMWPCYEMFSDTDIATSVNGSGKKSVYIGDMDAGYLEKRTEDGYNKFAFQEIASQASGNGWSFDYLRRINLMLSHIDDSNMSEEDKNHWTSVAYFFHSYWYVELINKFGDLPWVDTAMGEVSQEQFAPRLPRKEIADKVLTRLLWARDNIGDYKVYARKDGENTINQDCILALISRFTLREATWRKYHELGDYDDYLKECISASEILMERYPNLYYGTDGQPAAGYGEMWTTESLKGIPGIILYKEYVDEINCHRFSHDEHGQSSPVEMNQNTVDLYLMKNGLPISNDDSGYHGDKSPYTTFRDRDPRMYHVILPPYKVNEKKKTPEDPRTWEYTENPDDREYIDIMGENSECANPGVGMKRLPMQNWSGTLVKESPKFGVNTFVSSRSGYYVWKNSDRWETNSNSGDLNTADKPIFKIEEILLNYAEAKCEMNDFNQEDANASINKLRDRAGVTRMQVADINANFDPERGKYYPKGNSDGILVDPLLWEVRRERIIELMGEGFGFYDVRRWRMAPWFIDRTPKGMWMTQEDARDKSSEFKISITLLNPDTGLSDGVNGTVKEGNIYLFNDPKAVGKGWLEKYYLYQIPTTEILLNPNLAPNNPGWE